MRPIRPAALLALVALPAFASETAGPRPLAQAAAKGALTETKLPDELVGEVYGQMQEFTRSWGRHVLDAGSLAGAEDLRQAVEDAVRDGLQAQGIALSQQEAILDALRVRAETAVKDHARMVDAQARVKRALDASGTEEPAMSDVFEQVKEWAEDAHAAVVVPGVAGAGREPSADLVEREVGPLLDENGFPDKHRAEFLAALRDWLEARAALEGEAAQ